MRRLASLVTEISVSTTEMKIFSYDASSPGILDETFVTIALLLQHSV